MARDLRDDAPFTSGDFAPVGFIAYRLAFFNRQWVLEAVMAALVLMCDPDNWNTVGDLTPVQCADLAIQMVEGFNPMVPTVGVIYPFAGDTLPELALWCDGASYLRSDYAALFDTIGTLYGSADSTHFNVPDLRSRVPVGAGHGPGLPSYSLNDQFGEIEHVLTIGEMPSHSHTDLGHTHGESAAAPNATTIGPGLPEPTAVPAPSVTGSGSANLTSTGDGDAHNNVQPSIAINYVICTV